MIRPIRQVDNKSIENIIRQTFIDYKLPLVGTAYSDVDTPNMFESYDKQNSEYFVIEIDNEILGGIGFRPLEGNETICEICKMYFSPKLRGKGYGKKIFQYCLNEINKTEFKKCYLETIDSLEAAIHIYRQFGFVQIDEPIGKTGHSSCGYYMLKDL